MPFEYWRRVGVRIRAAVELDNLVFGQITFARGFGFVFRRRRVSQAYFGVFGSDCEGVKLEKLDSINWTVTDFLKEIIKLKICISSFFGLTLESF